MSKHKLFGRLQGQAESFMRARTQDEAVRMFMAQYMTLRQFLRMQEWAVHIVDVAARKYYCDSKYGPHWRVLPECVDVPEDVALYSFSSILRYIEHHDTVLD